MGHALGQESTVDYKTECVKYTHACTCSCKTLPHTVAK